MIQTDKLHHHERITAIFEAHGKTTTARALELYWEALNGVGLEDFDAAVLRAMQTLKWPARAAELRELAREAAVERQARLKPFGVYRCHAHEEHPDLPSPNLGEYRTVDWCDRCEHFVKLGKQEPAVAA